MWVEQKKWLDELVYVISWMEIETVVTIFQLKISERCTQENDDEKCELRFKMPIPTGQIWLDVKNQESRRRKNKQTEIKCRSSKRIRWSRSNEKRWESQNKNTIVAKSVRCICVGLNSNVYWNTNITYDEIGIDEFFKLFKAQIYKCRQITFHIHDYLYRLFLRFIF